MHRTIHIVLTLLLILSAALPPGLQAQQKGFAVSGTVMSIPLPACFTPGFT